MGSKQSTLDSMRTFQHETALVVAVAGIALLFSATAPSRALGQDVIVPPDATWTFFRGREEPPADWNTVDFDDSSWETGQAGFGYADGDDTTVLDDMMGNYVSVYIRHEFDVPAADTYALLDLGMRYDDGFVAYLNGVEVARSATMAANGTPPAFSETAGDHEQNPTPESFAIGAPEISALRAGKNVLAVQGHNTNITSSDFSLIAQLTGYTSLCPTVITCRTQSEQRVRVTWTLPVRTVIPDAIDIRRDGVFVGNPSSPQSRVFTDTDVPPGEHTYEVVATINGVECSGDGIISCTVVVEPEVSEEQFRRGDVDASGQVNLSDAIRLLISLFQGGGDPVCPDAADVNDTGDVNLTDAVFLLLHLFQSGPQPPAPGLESCGPDATEDSLATCAYEAC